MKPLALLASICWLASAACTSRPIVSDGAAGASGGNGGTSGGGASGSGGGASGTGGGGGASGSGGGGGTAGSGGAGGNPACASAVPTQPCNVEGTACGGENCSNVCRFCNLAVCTNGVWQRVEVAPYPCFACGPDLQCRSYTEYCRVTTGGPPPGGMWYRCAAVPAACTSTPTCGCLQSEGALMAGETCVQGGTAQLTVTLHAP